MSRTFKNVNDSVLVSLAEQFKDCTHVRVLRAGPQAWNSVLRSFGAGTVACSNATPCTVSVLFFWFAAIAWPCNLIKCHWISQPAFLECYYSHHGF